MRFIKPLDTDTIEPLITAANTVVVIEDGSKIGGVFHYILNEFSHLNKPLNDWVSFSIPDQFIDHGPVNDLFKEINLHPDQIKATLKERIKTNLFYHTQKSQDEILYYCLYSRYLVIGLIQKLK